MLRAPRTLPISYYSSCVSHAAVVQHTSPVSTDQISNRSAAGNQRFVSGKTEPHDFPFSAKSTEQNPTSTGCGTELLGQPRLPELVLRRQIWANCSWYAPRARMAILYRSAVSNTRLSTSGSTLIVVMGHQSCGAVTSLFGRKVGVGQSRRCCDPHCSFMRQDG